MPFEELKERQSVMWGSAPFENYVHWLAEMHDDLVRRLDPKPGERWVDLATGTGEVAFRAAEAGADVIVAQGTEGGGHVALISTLVLTPMVVRAVAPLPVLAAGGIADGAGLAAALMLGAEGALLGTRFLATPESSWPPGFKRALVESDGHDTLLSEIPDTAKGNVWPGAYDRVRRNRLLEDWLGRENEVRRHRAAIAARMRQAVEDGDAENGELNFGQAAGLVDEIVPAGELVRRISGEAERLLAERAGSVLDKSPA